MTVTFLGRRGTLSRRSVNSLARELTSPFTVPWDTRSLRGSFPDLVAVGVAVGPPPRFGLLSEKVASSG